MELWVELKRMYEPDPEDQLWTLTQNYTHAPVEWKLYDLSRVHHKNGDTTARSLHCYDEETASQRELAVSLRRWVMSCP
uniref:Uncharacterized protein n=1 Tax=Tanacetum cinerariifolium TaxID=118510 RepID=A0A699UMT4_TANCI|nr:hypothetical protein [Tanacetum cinerariifolium]